MHRNFIGFNALALVFFDFRRGMRSMRLQVDYPLISRNASSTSDILILLSIGRGLIPLSALGWRKAKISPYVTEEEKWLSLQIFKKSQDLLPRTARSILVQRYVDNNLTSLSRNLKKPALSVENLHDLCSVNQPPDHR